MKDFTYFTKKVLGLNLTTFETALFGSLLIMCLIIAVDTMSGRNIDSYEQVKLAKLQAQQDWMASRTMPNN